MQDFRYGRSIAAEGTFDHHNQVSIVRSQQGRRGKVQAALYQLGWLADSSDYMLISTHFEFQLRNVKEPIFGSPRRTSAHLLIPRAHHRLLQDLASPSMISSLLLSSRQHGAKCPQSRSAPSTPAAVTVILRPQQLSISIAVEEQRVGEKKKKKIPKEKAPLMAPASLF